MFSIKKLLFQKLKRLSMTQMFEINSIKKSFNTFKLSCHTF